MVLLDLQKAFDTVDHQILCKKLEYMGVGNIGLFHSYLAQREQIVTVDGIDSSPGTVGCGGILIFFWGSSSIDSWHLFIVDEVLLESEIQWMTVPSALRVWVIGSKSTESISLSPPRFSSAFLTASILP